MPASVHKLLVHGADIMRTLSLPAGMLSEEVQERRNKDIRKYWEHHTRKTSRANTMEDQLRYLLASSDPVIVEVL